MSLRFLCEEGGLLGGFLLALGRDLAVSFGNDALNGAERAGGNANTAAVDADGLEVNFLGAAGRDVRVAAGVHCLRAFAGDCANTGHIDGPDLSQIFSVWQEGGSMREWGYEPTVIIV